MPELARTPVNPQIHDAGARASVIVERSGAPWSSPVKFRLLSFLISLGLASLALGPSALAADQVMIAGIGSKSCAYWTSTPILKSEGEKWALGFWSALNYVAAVTKTQNQLIIDPDSMLIEIEKMCAQRPSQSLADSVWITFLTLNKSQ